jgi:hypothetical protein
MAYGVLPGLHPLFILGRLSFSAHDLLLPLSEFVNLGSGIGNLFWLMLLGTLVWLSRMRWTFALTFVALLPGLLVSGGRMTYLAMLGFSMGMAALLFDLAKWASSKINSKSFYPSLIGVTLILLIGYAIGGYRTSLIFIEAGRVSWSIPRQAKALVPELPPNAELYFTGIPEEAAFRWGMVHEVRYVFDDVNLPVYMVVDGPKAWDKISLQSIECDENIPRFYFRYFPEEKVLLQESADEFGISCQ